MVADCHLFHACDFVVTGGVQCCLCLAVSSFVITNVSALSSVCAEYS